MIKSLSMLTVLMLAGCGWLAGGADYSYKHIDVTGTEVAIEVHTSREVAGGIEFAVNPDGTATVKTGAVSSGPNNMVMIPVAIEQAAKILVR